MKTKRKPFTLLELLAAMTVFTIFMLAVMRFFGLTQDVISNSVENISHAEKVRVVMDLISNDLQNVYYEEGVNTLCYYATGSTSTETLDLTVTRPTKVNKSRTHLTWVRYMFNNTAKNLAMYAVGDDQYSAGKWKLHQISVTPSALYPASNLAASDGAMLLDGVYSFKLIPYQWTSSGFTEISSFDPTTNLRKLPDKIRIEIKLINSDIYEKYKIHEDTGMGKEITNTDLENASKVFTRDVIIDRGQF